MKKITLVTICCLYSILCFIIGIQLGLHKGKSLGYYSGYSKGWSDANCGVNNECEAGQE